MELLQNNIAVQRNEKVTLSYLFYTFLKIGSISFGGYMALVSLVQKIMVDTDETVDNAVIIDSITVASLIPGPVAVNIVAYIGYHLKGKMGAVVSMLGVLLPACSMMLIVAFAYFNYAYKFEWAEIMHYVVATVSAIILSTGFNLYKKEIGKNYKKALLCLFAIVVMSVTNSYIIIITFILLGAMAGLIIEGNTYSQIFNRADVKRQAKFSLSPASGLLAGLFVANEFLFISNIFKNFDSPLIKIFIAFSGISLSLFGGGYVMIPLMQTLFVTDLHWLTTQQFIDAIAFSQATPGPITVGMFTPSAILMIIVSKLFKKTKDHSFIKDMVTGIKVVVIGLIISSAIRILYQQPFSINIILIALVALMLSFKYKVSPVYLIIGSISIGIITKFLI